MISRHNDSQYTYNYIHAIRGYIKASLACLASGVKSNRNKLRTSNTFQFCLRILPSHTCPRVEICLFEYSHIGNLIYYIHKYIVVLLSGVNPDFKCCISLVHNAPMPGLIHALFPFAMQESKSSCNVYCNHIIKLFFKFKWLLALNLCDIFQCWSVLLSTDGVSVTFQIIFFLDRSIHTLLIVI